MTDSQAKIRAKIMVVDDDPHLRTTLSEILCLEGYDVITAEDGQHAVDLASGGPIDLAFMDIQMPGLNGVDAFLHLKRVQPDCIVVMMTAFSVEHLVNTALSEGAYTVLYKPLAVEKVLELLEKAVSESIKT